METRFIFGKVFTDPFLCKKKKITVAIISCSKRSFCHFGAVDFILLNRFSEIPSPEIIPYCFSYHFFDSHRLSFLLFSLLAPLIFITDPSLASSRHPYPQGLFDLFQVHSLVWVGPAPSDKCPLPPLHLPPQIRVYGLSEMGCHTTS